MPKSTKKYTKQKKKSKQRVEPETSNITTKRSYWIVLVTLLAVISVVFGTVMGFDMLQTTVLAATVIVVIGVVGLIRVCKSQLSLSKRATFIVVGASFIGFGTWAAIILSGIAVIVQSQGLYVVTSLLICLAIGALIGDMLGRNKKIQEKLFLDIN